MALYRPSRPVPIAPSGQPQEGFLGGIGDLFKRGISNLGGALQNAGSDLSRLRTEQPGMLSALAMQNASASHREAMAPAAELLFKGNETNAKYEDRLKILQKMGIDPASPQGQQYLLGSAGSLSGATTYGKTPVWGRDSKTGKMGMGVIGDDGTFKILDTGSFEPKRVLEWRDTKTHHEGVDPFTGEVVESIPIENTQAARETEVGKGLGITESEYRQIVSKMPALRETAKTLSGLAEQATYTVAGVGWDQAKRQFAADPGLGAQARAEYQAIVRNTILPLLRATFGAQFTKAEGDSLLEILGGLDQSPSEKQAVLNAFIRGKELTLESQYRELTSPTDELPTPDSGGGRPRKTIGGRTYEQDENGDWEDVTSG